MQNYNPGMNAASGSNDGAPRLAIVGQHEIFGNISHGLLERLSNLENELKTVKDQHQQVIINNRTLRKDNNIIRPNKKLVESVYWMEVDICGNNQYSHRENVEFANIPESVIQKDLENYIINVLKAINVKVSSNNIVAVHRLGKRRNGIDRNVIVCFVNRKFTISALKNKKQLLKDNAYKKIIILENLSPINKKIYDQCFKLKCEGIFKSLWAFNGVIYVKFTSDYDELPTNLSFWWYWLPRKLWSGMWLFKLTLRLSSDLYALLIIFYFCYWQTNLLSSIITLPTGCQFSSPHGFWLTIICWCRPFVAIMQSPCGNLVFVYLSIDDIGNSSKI